jgi:diaminobutyrate-2-oxoglutarate transaminase
VEAALKLVRTATGRSTVLSFQGGYHGMSQGALSPMGDRLGEHLRILQRDFPQLGDIRGRGLMLGVELVDPSGVPDAQGHPPIFTRLSRMVQRECLKRGLILELGGRHGGVVRFLPPLVITSSEIDQVAEIFGRAMAAATASL